MSLHLSRENTKLNLNAFKSSTFCWMKSQYKYKWIDYATLHKYFKRGTRNVIEVQKKKNTSPEKDVSFQNKELPLVMAL